MELFTLYMPASVTVTSRHVEVDLGLFAALKELRLGKKSGWLLLPHEKGCWAMAG